MEGEMIVANTWRFGVAAFVTLLTVATGGVASAQQDVSDVTLQRFIDIGGDDDFGDIRASCRARPSGWGGFLSAAAGAGTRSYSVSLTTWLGRVALEAMSRESKLLPLPTPDDMRLLAEAPSVVVSVSPMALDMPSAALLADIEHVVLRLRGDDDNETVIQPTAVDAADTMQFSNLFGASYEATGIIAAFDAEPVLALAREKDLTAVLITPGGDQIRCNLDDRKIKRQFGIW